MQILADLQTIQESLGRLEGIRLTYTGVHNNVTNSLIAAAVKLGMEITVVAPETNPAALDEELFQEARNLGAYRTADDLRAAVERSDIIYTDTWIDMEYFNDAAFAEEKERRCALMLPYQLNAELLAGSDAKVMHDMPMHLGYEITEELAESERSIIYDQAENRLDAQKAILLTLV
jgi:ornithine carbamoyltransferase